MALQAIQHSDLCGCERCAIQAEKEYPQKVYDYYEDDYPEEDFEEDY